MKTQQYKADATLQSPIPSSGQQEGIRSTKQRSGEAAFLGMAIVNLDTQKNIKK